MFKKPFLQLVQKNNLTLLILATFTFLFFSIPNTSAQELIFEDDFSDTSTFGDWLQVHEESSVMTHNPWEEAYIDETTGQLVLVPYAGGWFDNFMGGLMYKEVTGNFVASTHVTSTNRAGNNLPQELYSLAGFMVRGEQNGNDERYWVFGSLGAADQPGDAQMEVKITQNNDSTLEILNIAEAEGDLKMAYLDGHVIFLVRFDGGDWQVAKRFYNQVLANNQNHQIGVVAYSDWNDYKDIAPSEFNANGSGELGDLRATFDYVRVERLNNPNAVNPNNLSDDELIDWIVNQNTAETEPVTEPDPTEPSTDPVTEPSTDPTSDPATEPTTDPSEPTNTDPMPVEPDGGIGDGAEPLPENDSNTQDTTDKEPLPSNTITFPDVKGHWGETFIKKAADLEILTGYENGFFGPDDAMLRYQGALVTCRAFVGKDIPSASEAPFDDVPQDHVAAGCIQELKKRGITTGYEGTNLFGINDSLYRDQAVTLFMRAAGIEAKGNLANPFKDVPQYWATEWITTAYNLNIIDGETTDTFNPNGLFSRAAGAKVILNTLSAQ